MVSVFKDRLKAVRKQQNMTQQDLARALGLEKSAVSKYERGINSVDANLLVQICRALDVTADYLLGLSDMDRWPVSNSDTDILTAYHAAPAEIKVIVDTALEPYKKGQSADSIAS